MITYYQKLARIELVSAQIRLALTDLVSVAWKLAFFPLLSFFYVSLDFIE